MNNQTLYPIPGQNNTNTILNNSAQRATQQSNDIASNLKNPSQTSSVLSGINGLNAPFTSISAPAQDSGNWLTKLIPTLGSIGGGILGGIGGSFLAPGVGTFGGGVAGSAAGDAFGKSIENALEGKDTTAEDLGSSALEGAGGQVLGAGIGKVIGAGGKLIGNIGSRGIAEESAAKGAQGAVDEAQRIRNTYGGIKNAILEKNDLNGVLGHAKSLGIDHLNPSALSSTSQMANDILNEQLNQALIKNGSYNGAGINDIFRNAIGKNANLIGGVDAVAKSKGLMGLPNTPGAKLYGQLQDMAAGLANRAEADPTEVRTLISNVGNAMADAKPTIGANGVIDPIEKAKYNTLKDIYAQLKATLYDNPELSKSVTAIKGNLLPENVGGNQLLADHLNAVLTNAKSPQDLLDGLSQFTRMSKIGMAGEDLAKNTAKVADVNAAKQALPIAEGGSGVAPGNPLANTVAASNHPVGKLLGSILNIGSKGGTTGKAAVNLGSVLERLAPMTGTVTGQTIANSPNYTGAAGEDTAIGENMIPTGIGASGNPTADILASSSPNTVALKQLLTLAQNGGGYNVPNEMSTFAAPAADELKTLNGINSAQSQLASLVDLYNKAGGAQGPIGGILAKLGGALTGSPAASYDGQADQLVKEISGITGTQINAPSLTMNKTAANGVLAQLQAALAAYGGGGGISSLGVPGQ